MYVYFVYFFHQTYCISFLALRIGINAQILLSCLDLPERVMEEIVYCFTCLWPQVGAIVKIQAFFRANKAREEYRMLGKSLGRM